MRRLTDAIGGILLAALVIKLLFDLIAPYAFFIAIAVVVIIAGSRVIERYRQQSW